MGNRLASHARPLAEALSRLARDRSGNTLAIIAAVLTVGLVTFANLTRDRIARNQQVWIKQHLDALVPPKSYDNDPRTIEKRMCGNVRLHTQCAKQTRFTQDRTQFSIRKGVAARSQFPHVR